KYYGEVSFTMEYKKQKTKPFDWLYVDFETLKHLGKKAGLNCELVLEGKHFDYLARLKYV
ncbi:MAG: SAM-dependent methyltransferase, partial [Bacteroidota bacterium]